MASSNLPPVWRFDFGDYTGLGSVFQKFLSNLNLFTLNTYSLLNKGLSFDNMQRAVYSTTILASAAPTLSFVNPLTIAPSSVSLVKVLVSTAPGTAITNAVSVANWNYDGKNINVLSIPGLTNGTSYSISLEVA